MAKRPAEPKKQAISRPSLAQETPPKKRLRNIRVFSTTFPSEAVLYESERGDMAQVLQIATKSAPRNVAPGHNNKRTPLRHHRPVETKRALLTKLGILRRQDDNTVPGVTTIIIIVEEDTNYSTTTTITLQ